MNFDDPQYVIDNPVIRLMNAENIKAIFTNQYVGNYQPLTMLSYMVDYALWGMKPFAFHFINLVLHLLSTLLVFLIIEKISQRVLVAFITAILFGIHPMHVESVAWIAERKDVLYGLTFLWSLYLYLLHLKTERNFSKYYLFSLFLFAISVLCKAQAVILPVVFFLFDYLLKRKAGVKLFFEKIPFLILAIAFGMIAITVQKKAGAMQDFNYFPFLDRILFICYAMVNYLWRIIIPFNLSCFYPYPETGDKINSNWVYVSPFILIFVAFLIYRILKSSRREVTFGICFFLITIVLVLQFIPLADALYADRYTYIPSIGLFFIGGIYYDKYISEKANLKKTLQVAMGSYLLFLSVTTFNRTMVWKDSITLYSDAIEKFPNVPILYNNRGAALSDKKDYESALNDFTSVVNIKPRFPNGFKNRALTYQKLNDNQHALEDWNNALKYNSNDFNLYTSRADLLKSMGNYTEAIKDYSKIIEMKPDMSEAYYARAEAYGRTGKNTEALEDINKVIFMKPGYAEAYSNRGIIYGSMGKTGAAIADFSKAIEINPTLGNTYSNRSVSFKAQQNYQSAYEDAMKASQLGFPMDQKYVDELKRLAGK